LSGPARPGYSNHSAESKLQAVVLSIGLLASRGSLGPAVFFRWSGVGLACGAAAAKGTRGIGSVGSFHRFAINGVKSPQAYPSVDCPRSARLWGQTGPKDFVLSSNKILEPRRRGVIKGSQNFKRYTCPICRIVGFVQELLQFRASVPT